MEGIPIFILKYGHTVAAAEVVCPQCGESRLVSYNVLNARARPGSQPFTGSCRGCHDKTTSARMKIYRGPQVRSRISHNGYIIRNSSSIAKEHWAFYEAMRGKANWLLEHRLVMAIHLNRPLRPDEFIDHMDGDKQNNSVDNLRIYVQGKNQPGSCRGGGTYYHEWQMAERRAELAEAMLLSACSGT